MTIKRILLTGCLILISMFIGSGSYLIHEENKNPPLKPTIIKQPYSRQQINHMDSNQLYKLRGNNKLSQQVSDNLYQDINYQRVIHHLPPVQLDTNMQKVSDIRNIYTYNAYLNEYQMSKYHDKSSDDWIHGNDKQEDFNHISKSLGINPSQWGECAGELTLSHNRMFYPGFKEIYPIKTPSQMANTIITSQIYHDGIPEIKSFRKDKNLNNHNEHRNILLNQNAKYVGISTYYYQGVNSQHNKIPLLSSVADFSN